MEMFSLISEKMMGEKVQTQSLESKRKMEVDYAPRMKKIGKELEGEAEPHRIVDKLVRVSGHLLYESEIYSV